jgi:hypothetical protein
MWVACMELNCLYCHKCTQYWTSGPIFNSVRVKTVCTDWNGLYGVLLLTGAGLINSYGSGLHTSTDCTHLDHTPLRTGRTVQIWTSCMDLDGIYRSVQLVLAQSTCTELSNPKGVSSLMNFYTYISQMLLCTDSEKLCGSVQLVRILMECTDQYNMYWLRRIVRIYNTCAYL